MLALLVTPLFQDAQTIYELEEDTAQDDRDGEEAW